MERERRPGLILQHGDDGPPGILGEWLHEESIAYEVHRTWADPLPADPGDHDWIATLGSEHTPGSAEAPAWVDREIAFLAAGLEAGVPVLGLCFGGQALAAACGGSVERASPAEVGWLEVETANPDLIPPGPWLHYHYDQMRPPTDAVVLAHSPAGPAAFALERSLGLQFHPESTPGIAAEWARQDERRLVELGIDPERLAAAGEAVAQPAARAARRLFSAWFGRAGWADAEWVHYPSWSQSMRRSA